MLRKKPSRTQKEPEEKIKITPPIRINPEDYKIYKASLIMQHKKLCDEIGNLISAEVERIKKIEASR